MCFTYPIDDNAVYMNITRPPAAYPHMFIMFSLGLTGFNANFNLKSYKLNSSLPVQNTFVFSLALLVILATTGIETFQTSIEE